MHHGFVRIGPVFIVNGQRHLAYRVNTLWIFQLCRCRVPRILSKFVSEKRIS